MTDPHGYRGAPRWVKVSGLVTLALLLAFVAMHLSGHALGEHGGVHGEHAHPSATPIQPEGAP